MEKPKLWLPNNHLDEDDKITTLIAVSPEVIKASVTPPGQMDSAMLWYMFSVIAFGALAALSSLLGDETKKVTFRVVSSYCILGGVASAGVVLLLIETYGFSWFLLGLSIFSGYKAVDIMALSGYLVKGLFERITGTQSKPPTNTNDKA